MRDARIVGIESGHWQGRVALRLEGATIVEKKTARFPLPGTIDLGEGLSIS